MEKTVNEMLSDEISKVNHTLVPQGYRSDVRSVRVMQDWLSRVIDALGEQSSTAQGLSKVITTSDKLRNAPNHILYLMKDGTANGGAGEVVGLLKIGRKHLFLWDEAGQVYEVEPLCILDFYVLNSRQRHGLGTKLFQYMLDEQKVPVEDFAIDAPSPKMESFLANNYGIKRLIRQANNFAIAPEFFTKEHQSSSLKHDTSAPLVGRFAAHQPVSHIGNVIHGNDNLHHGMSNGWQPLPMRPAEMPVPASAPELEAEEPDTAEPAHPAAESARPAEEAAQPAAEPARPDSLAVTPAAGAHSQAGAGAGYTPRLDSQLTERGYFDIKFYHNKLW